MYKTAIIGFGAVAENAHIPALKNKKKFFNVAAVVDNSAERLKKAKQFFPKARLYKTDTELFKKEKIDVTIIATPPSYHYVSIVKALDNNSNVLCEKPLVLNLTELKKLEKKAKEKKLCLFTVHNWKYAPAIIKAKQLTKKLGDIHHIELHILRSQPSITAGGKDWRSDLTVSGGGIFTDHGWHNLYLAYYLSGNILPTKISAQLSYGKTLAENEASVLIKFGEISAFIYLTWKSVTRQNSIFIYGSKANMQVLDDTIILQEKGRPDKKFKLSEKLSAGSAHPEWMSGMLSEFLSEIKNSEKRYENLKEAKVCLSLLQAGYKSAKTDKDCCRIGKRSL